MAQTGFTPIQLYSSSTASAAPTSGNLVAGELAINTADGKLFYLDNLNAVQVIGWKLVPATAGGTGLSSYTTGDTLYSSATNTLAKLPIGSTGQVLTVASGLPAWSSLPAQVYPGAGIPNSTGSAWGTSYSVTGTGNVVLSDGPSLSGAIFLGSTTDTATLTVGRSTGTQTLSIGSGAAGSTVTTGGTRTINIGTTSAGTGISNVTIGKQSATVNHTTTINGRYVTLNATTTLSLSSPSLALPQNTYISPITVADLTTLTGVVQSSRCFVTDALNPQTGAIAVGGGSTPVPVYYDGTNWRCDSGLGTLSGSIVGTTDTQTLTNKRITSRSSTTTSSATPTINTDNTDIFGLTAQAVDITSFTTNLSGTPTDGQKLWIYIVGTAARAITWGASFESSTATLPTTTVTTNRLDIGFVWNVATSKWRCVAVA